MLSLRGGAPCRQATTNPTANSSGDNDNQEDDEDPKCFHR
jgi:hypothetical protein